MASGRKWPIIRIKDTMELLYKVIHKFSINSLSILRISFFSALLIIVFGCSRDIVPEMEEDGIIKLRIMPSVESDNSATRASMFPDSTLKLSGQNSIDLGMWICKTDREGVYEPYTHGMDNMKSTYSETSNDKWIFNYGEGVHSDIGIKPGQKLSVYAYFPYTEYAEGQMFTPEEVPFKSGYDDILWADPVHVADEITDSDSETKTLEVNLKFHHAMTCIEVQMKTRLPAKVKLTKAVLLDKNERGIIRKSGKLNILNGTIKINESDVAYELPLNIKEISINNTVWQSFYFLIPQIDTYDDGDLSVKFTFDDIEKTYSLPCCRKDDGTKITSFVRGHRYVYTCEPNNENTFNTPIMPGSEEDWIIKPETIFEL